MKSRFPVLLSCIVFCSLASCRNAGKSGNEKSSSGKDAVVPVLTPEESMKTMKLARGFTIKLVASEPLVRTPVAMAFDDSLRMWVVEMSDYQPIEENRDKRPTGKIVILKDRNGDGVMDERKVFLDSLVMPRAICLVDSGILVAAPPNLWYIAINGDRPGKKICVDSMYTVSGNPEGQTNGLLRSMDNWIYDAGFGSNKRYRKIDGKWLTEPTHLRGQWGISQDNYGRLFYNNNSQNLLGDYLLPGLGAGNKWQKKVAGYDEKIVADNRVYPARPTPGVNRGYRKGILDDSLRLVHFTAACGPLIYRGGLFGNDYNNNAFVCEPAAYLIKRDILKTRGYRITGKQAWQNKEFLSATDERFRPVSLYNGPDGALYIVDMYRGIIQDQLSLTDYLKKYTLDHKLDMPVSAGRIYKVVPRGKEARGMIIPSDPDALVGLLKSPNGWVRDHAQQRLVDSKDLRAVPALRQLLFRGQAPVPRIHALWALEGLQKLTPDDIIRLLKEAGIHMRTQALYALTSVINSRNSRRFIPVIRQLTEQNDSLSAPYIAYAINSLHQYAPAVADRYMKILIGRYPRNMYVADAFISRLQDQGMAYLQKFPDTTTLFHQRLQKTFNRKTAGKKTTNMVALKKKYADGYAIFNTVCQTCHNSDGNGIQYLAPPLNGSSWVTGNKKRLISIVLHGLAGPVKVGGKIYKTPEVTGDMPGFGNNPEFSDQALAELLSFIRNAWGNQADEVSGKDVAAIRHQFQKRDRAFTTRELDSLFTGKKQ